MLAPDEVITRVVVPLPGRGERVRLYKISKRKEMDISTFRAGGPGPRVGRAGSTGRPSRSRGWGRRSCGCRATEAFLAGRPFAEATFREAGRLARAEVEPISDVRGSRDFRLLLAENILLKFYHDCAGESAGRRRPMPDRRDRRGLVAATRSNPRAT